MKTFVYSDYGICVVVFANSKYEAFGYLVSQKDESNNRKYYINIDDIIEITDDSKNNSIRHIDIRRNK